jgi:hypothetical protein
VHQVSDWCSGAAADFGWMREAKRENTRCGLRPMSDKAAGQKTRSPEGCRFHALSWPIATPLIDDTTALPEAFAVIDRHFEPAFSKKTSRHRSLRVHKCRVSRSVPGPTCYGRGGSEPTVPLKKLFPPGSGGVKFTAHAGELLAALGCSGPFQSLAPTHQGFYDFVRCYPPPKNEERFLIGSCLRKSSPDSVPNDRHSNHIN